MPTLEDIFEKTGLMVAGINIFSSKSAKKARELATEALKGQLEIEFSTENIAFLQAIYDLYLQKKEPSREELMELYNNFINPDVPDNTQVNLNSANFKSLKMAVEKGPLTLDSFANAAHEIIGLISKDSIPRLEKRRPELIEDLKPNLVLANISALFEKLRNSFSQLVNFISNLRSGDSQKTSVGPSTDNFSSGSAVPQMSSDKSNPKEPKTEISSSKTLTFSPGIQPPKRKDPSPSTVSSNPKSEKDNRPKF